MVQTKIGKEKLSKLQVELNDGGPVTPEQLLRVLDSNKAELLDMAGGLPEPGSFTYGRKVLYSSDSLEAVLVHLPPGAETMIHDHGASVGCGIVLEGEMTNRVYALDAYGYPVPEQEMALACGDRYVSTVGQIHQLANTGGSRAVCIHLYAPSLAGTKVYYPYEQALDFVI